ncbi:MAG: hypothetical protein IT203_10055 [Fimbriimonadaceae bacterium]|nr:hypothetical protein [Fimbriimonadaceae bacterium]
MARKASIVLLFALVSFLGIAQGGSVTASVRGGFEFLGNDGKGSGTIVGEIKLGSKPTADIMFVVKDTGGATREGLEEAIIFLKSVAKHTLKGNVMTVVGLGTYQGDSRTVELTITDSQKANIRDTVRVRVLKGSFVEYDHTASLDAKAVTVTKG